MVLCYIFLGEMLDTTEGTLADGGAYHRNLRPLNTSYQEPPRLGHFRTEGRLNLSTVREKCARRRY